MIKKLFIFILGLIIIPLALVIGPLLIGIGYGIGGGCYLAYMALFC